MHQEGMGDVYGQEEIVFDIDYVIGREVLDSRCSPTVEAEGLLGSGGRAIVPSGASTGSREALELRDTESARYLGKGVQTAVAHVNGPLADAVEELDARDPARRRPGLA